MPPAMRPHLVHAFPYPPGRPIEDVQREYGLSSVIKLASNENPLGPSPKAIEAMKRCAAEMNLYPDGAAYYLRLALAEKHGVEPERIVFGAGSDDLNGFVAMCYVGPGRTLVCSEGSFIRYEQSAIVSGGQARRVPFKNWRHDVDALLGAIDETTGAVCVANPENPAGSMLTRAEVDRLVSGTPDSVLLLLDEAYFEFAENEPDYPDSLEYLKSRDNVMVSRTFSKAYGLAGLRVGYAIATADIVQTLDRVRPPFNVSRMAQEAALAALDDTEHLRRTRELNAREKAWYEAQCERLGLEYIKSCANFISVNIGRDAKPVFEALLRQGVIVRPLAGYGMPSWLRISFGLPEENKRCMAALESILSESAKAG